MDKARIKDTDEIVMADTILDLYPNYSELEFVCIDEICSVRMSPTCIKKTERKKPHFKKYRNREHIETCEYATLSKLYQKGGDQKLNKIEINKIGYPSVFILNDDEEDFKKITKARLDSKDEGVSGRGNAISKVYEFDDENVKFDRKNRVQSIDRIVNWYLGFPHNRDVEIEINSIKIAYRYFFKQIKYFTDPIKLQNERIFYGKLILSKTNKNVFDKYTDCVYFNLLAYKDEFKKKSNYSVKIDKKLISKHSLSRLKNKYDKLFDKAFTELEEGTNEPNFGLYVFVYGTIDENNDTIMNVKQNHITFRYDEVRKTIIEV
ncbi:MULTISPECIES: hypothetical protein [Flavobacterium]|uniref:Uncharacterized protein n=1 Tax=Flavobacterium ranwuense TaxID=2541725 RepID=A0ABY2DY39_9FLAO|nr:MULTISPECIES: hypothetical protein [Flavobacterium]RTY67107.1 hypothetical protein EKL95_10025 [Flavobacterium sp. LB2P53]TDE30465.1 hypothetical protein E0I61_05565 [Flavobacterium ranwuense]